jgi:hypothetical protein
MEATKQYPSKGPIDIVFFSIIHRLFCFTYIKSSIDNHLNNKSIYFVLIFESSFDLSIRIFKKKMFKRIELNIRKGFGRLTR